MFPTNKGDRKQLKTESKRKLKLKAKITRVVSQEHFLYRHQDSLSNLRICSHKKYELKHKRASRSKYETRLSLTHFLWIGILQRDRKSVV